ncbi:protein O-mannosyl-transferase TMTC4-like [Hetaerina americana]|uniref:protein O-mannosyl-transferase TMTC4-like n=1 Tax=Hetaerina americana TaxID=62018 RepID=UPI003A7F2BE1
MSLKCNSRNGKQSNGFRTNSSGNLLNCESESNTWDSSIPLPSVSRPLSIVIVALAAFLTYFNSLDGNFVFDDSEAIVKNKDVHPEAPLWNVFQNDFWGTPLKSNNSHKSYRPLTVLTFRWNCWMSGGLWPFGFHLINVLLHAIVSVLMLPSLERLFLTPCPRASLLAALLFAVHPIHAEAVAGIVGRADLLCALFFLLSFLAYCQAVDKSSCPPGQSIPNGSSSNVWLFVSMLLCSVSMFCKEQGITVIGLCSVYDVIGSSQLDLASIIEKNHKGKNGSVHLRRNPPRKIQRWHPILVRHLLLLLTGIGLLTFRWKVMASSPPVFHPVDNPASFSDSILTQVLTHGYVWALNAWLLLCPEWLCFDWSMGSIPLISSPTSDPRALIALPIFCFIMVVLGAQAFLHPQPSHSNRVLAMGLALLSVPFLPASNLFFRVGFVVAERVLYIPSAGYCIIVVLGLCHLSSNVSPSQRNLLLVMYVCLLMVLGIRSVVRSAQWRTEESLFISGLGICPLNAKVHYNVARNAADRGDRSLALYHYREAIRLHPEYDQAMNNLANLLKDNGGLMEAEVLLRKAVSLRHDFSAGWMNLGVVLAAQKRYEEAEQSYLTALRHRRSYADCFYNLGNLYVDQNRYKEAFSAWQNATSLKPTHAGAWSNMVGMLDSIGKVTQAEELAKQALGYLPEEPALHFHLGNSYGKRGRYSLAEQHFLKAISIRPRHAPYHSNLGVLYHHWKKYGKAETSYLRAIELDPSLHSAHENLRLLHRKTKQRTRG